MNGLQRGIKYAAIAFAVLLAVSIIAAIAGAGITVLNMISGSSFDGGSIRDFDQTYTEEIRNITIEGGFHDLNVVSSTENTVRVEMRGISDKYKAELSGKTLKLSGRSNGIFNWFGNNKSGVKGKITLYMPEALILDQFKIEVGMGDVDIEAVNASYLRIDSGAGNINGENMTASEVDIDGGMGNIDLDRISFGASDIDGGMGNINISGELFGDADIDCGMGELELNLLGSIDDYNIKTDNGMGDVRINGQKYSEIRWDNTMSKYTLDIDGGMGNIDLSFAD